MDRTTLIAATIASLLLCSGIFLYLYNSTLRDSSESAFGNAFQTTGITSTQNNSACFMDGEKILDGNQIIAYRNEFVSEIFQCEYEIRSCANGKLDGSYENADCKVTAKRSRDCRLDNGEYIKNGDSVFMYNYRFETLRKKCTSELRMCNNGTLSGTYENPACRILILKEEETESCTLGEETIEHGDRVVRFEKEIVNEGETCVSQERACLDGVIEGEYEAKSCTVSTNIQRKCEFNEKDITSGNAVIAYKEAKAINTSCESEVRVCSDGNLSGDFKFQNCFEVR